MRAPVPGTYLILSGTGVVPALPPAGVRIKEDVLFNPDIHLLPGSWAYNRTDRKWYYATDYGIADYTDQMGYVDPDPAGTYELALGNPAADGYILSSLTDGTRSWIAPPTGGGGTSNHNLLLGIQGGIANEYYHLSANLYNAFEYVPNSGNPYLRIKLPIAGDYEIQAYSDFSQFPPTIWESLPVATYTTLGGVMLDSAVSDKFLRGDGTWQTIIVGSGTVDTSGTPVDNQVAVFTDANTIEGHSGFTYNSATGTLDVTTIARPAGHLQNLSISAGNASGATNDGGDLILKAGNAVLADAASDGGRIYLVPGNGRDGSPDGTVFLGDSNSIAAAQAIIANGSRTSVNLYLRAKGNGNVIIGGTGMSAAVYSPLAVTGLLNLSSDIAFTNSRNAQIRGVAGGTTNAPGYSVSIIGGAGSSTINSNSDGGDLLLYGGAPFGTGTRGNVYFGSGSAGYLPAQTSETNVVHYDTATGKISYGIPSHNNLASIQGGDTGEYYHLTANLHNAFEYVANSGNPYLRVKLPIACDYDIQAYSDFSQFPPTIWESMPLATSTTIGGIQLGSGNTLFLREDGTWQAASGESMVYPGAGIPVSTGSGWGTSITNNSANWNTAYGWGNHASANYTVAASVIADNSVLRGDGGVRGVQGSPLTVGDATGDQVMVSLADNTDMMYFAAEPGNDRTGYLFGRTSQLPLGTGYGSYMMLVKAPASGTYNHAAGFVAGKTNGEIVHFYNWNGVHLLRINTNASDELVWRASSVAGSDQWHAEFGADPYMVIGGAAAARVGTNDLTVVGTGEFTTGLTVGGTAVSLSGHTHAESSITFTDIITGNATTGQHGYLPKLGGGTTNFLRADGTWAAPTASIADGDKGDITVSSSGATWTIDNSAVTYAKMQNVSVQNRILGRISSGTATVAELTGTEVTSLLDTFSTSSTTKGLVPGSNGVGTSRFLRADGTWAIPGGGPWTMLSCTADQLVTNSSVLEASSYLTFTTSPNTNYHIRLRVLFNSGNSTADIKYRVTHGGTTTRVRRVGTYSVPNGTSATLPTIAPSTAFDSADQTLLATVTGDSIVYEDIYLEVGASGGTLTISFAQNTQTAGASVTLYRGSYMEYMTV